MGKVTRRHALAGLAANMAIMNPGTALGSKANSAVGFGVIGTGGRGRRVGRYMSEDKNARLLAICDLYPDQIDRAKTDIPAADGARSYKDYKELLAQKDIDAVLIATPVFAHPEHFEAAVKANKHIYCEKPAGADVAGVKRLMAAGERANKSKSIAFGYQQRYSPEYLAGLDMLRSGEMGDLHLMMSYWVWGGNAFQDPTQPEPANEAERKRRWHQWKDLSGDFIVEQDCHGLDVLNWFADAIPLKAIGDGGRKARKIGDNTDHACIIYTYPEGLKGWLLGTQLPPRAYWDVKEQFFGTLGVLETARSHYAWTPAGSREVSKRVDSKGDVTISAVADFFQSIVDGKPISMWKSAGESTLTALLGRMAAEQKREVTWDEMWRSG